MKIVRVSRVIRVLGLLGPWGSLGLLDGVEGNMGFRVIKGSTVASALATARRIPSLCLAASLPASLLRPNELLGERALVGDDVYLPNEFRRCM